MFFFGDAVALLRESYTFVWRNSYGFLALSDRALDKYVYLSFDRSSTTGFECNSLHAKSVDCVACCICRCSVKFIEVMKLMYFLNLCRQSHLDVAGVLP